VVSREGEQAGRKKGDCHRAGRESGGVEKHPAASPAEVIKNGSRKFISH
jgi:hypothetical protein